MGATIPQGSERQQPRIGIQYLGAFHQRQLALSICALIQCIKAAEAFSYNLRGSGQAGVDDSKFDTLSSPFHLFLKYTLVDILLLTLVIALRIFSQPFSRRLILLILCSIAITNLLIFGTWSLSHSVLSLWPGFHAIFDIFFGDTVITASGRKLRVSQLRLLTEQGPDAGRSGEHMIQVMPHATANLNPANDRFCLARGVGSVFVPLLVNSSIPRSITFKVVDLQDGTTNTKFYNTNDIKLEASRHSGALESSQSKSKGQLGQSKDAEMSLDDDDDDEDAALLLERKRHVEPDHQRLARALKSGQSLYTIPFSKPARYVIDSLIDIDGFRIKSDSSEITIAPCPFAKLLEAPSKVHRCVGENFRAELAISGIAPLQISYQRFSAGKAEQKSIESIGLRDMSGSGHYVHDSVIPLEWPMLVGGEHGIAVSRVRDALGNTQEYRIHKGPSTDVHSTSAHTVHAHSLSSVSWRSCSPEIPNRLLDGQTVRLALDAENASETDTFDIRVGKSNKIYAEEESPPSLDTSDFIYNVSMKGRSGFFETSSNGTFVLLSGIDKHCPMHIKEPATCPVRTIPYPQVSVEFSDIQDDCAGSVGMRAMVTFTAGEPPFSLSYDVYRNEKLVDTRIERFNGGQKTGPFTRHSIRYVPPNEAKYRYVVKSAGDANYRAVPVIAEWAHEVRPLATASIVRAPAKKLRSCSGDNFDLEIALDGIPPWTLDYEIVSYGTIESFQLPKLRKPIEKLELTVPKRVKTRGGSFTVELTSVTDGKGCRRVLNAEAVQIEVKRDRPSINFASPIGSTIFSLEGQQTEIPLRLTGDGPWVVEYLFNEALHVARLENSNGPLAIQQEGRYKLFSVKDQFCPGVVGAHNSIEVEWYPKPTVNWHLDNATGTLPPAPKRFIKPTVCRDSFDYIDLDMTGTAPFEIEYRVSKDSEKAIVESLHAALPRARLVMKTDLAGAYHYTFDSLADEHYQPQLLGDLVIEQTVAELPVAKIVNPKLRRSICKGSAFGSMKAEDLSLTLEGTAPFSIDVIIIEEESGKSFTQKFDGISSSHYVVRPDFIPTSGLYSIKVSQIRDANGCISKSEKAYERRAAEGHDKLIVQVLETAEIQAIDTTTNACVGDSLDFVLDGTPPWTVEYSFEGRKQKVKTNGPHFSRIADEPGLFAIQAISHSNSRCDTIKIETAEGKGLIKHIRPLPFANIQGQKAGDKMFREGEQFAVSIRLSGTPPFTFTWHRKDAKGEIAEEHTVVDFEGMEYTIHTYQEGYYQIIYMRDRYCSSPKRHPKA